MRPILGCHLRNPLVLSLICEPRERFVTSGSLTSALMSYDGRTGWCQLPRFRTATITRIAHLKRYFASASAKASFFYLGIRSKRAADRTFSHHRADPWNVIDRAPRRECRGAMHSSVAEGSGREQIS